MTTELWMLAGMAALQLALLMTHGTQIALSSGVAWGTGRRDIAMPITDLGRRIDRTIQNTMESLSVFVPIVLALHFAGISTPSTVMAAQIYLAARIAFAGIYLAGIPVIRTVVWFIGNVAMIVMAWPLISSAFGSGFAG